MTGSFPTVIPSVLSTSKSYDIAQPTSIQATTAQRPGKGPTTAAEESLRNTQGKDALSTSEYDIASSITAIPVLTTVAPVATSSISSISSQVAALIPVIERWKDDPEGLKEDTNNKVQDVHHDISVLVVGLGVNAYVGYSGKSKRGPLDAIIDNLVCMADDVMKVSASIAIINIPNVINAVSDFQDRNEDLADMDNTTTTEEPTTSKETTASVEPSTTSTETFLPCASDTCGGRESRVIDAGPLSDLQMRIMETGPSDCKNIPITTTHGNLPTAPGKFGPISMDGPTRSPEPGSNLKPRLSPRVFADSTSPNPFYVMALRPTWVSQLGNTSGHFFYFPKEGHAAAGVNGLYGCTAVIIASDMGVYLSHIWESPVFGDINFVPSDDAYFTRQTIEIFRDGSSHAQSVNVLVGTDAEPGPLHPIHSPKVFVVTPLTKPEQSNSVTTLLFHQDRAQTLANNLASIIVGSEDHGHVLGYVRTNHELSTSDKGYWGRTILEVDMFQKLLVSADNLYGEDLAVGRWRLWLEDKLITFNDFISPYTFGTPTALKKRNNKLGDECSIDVCFRVEATSNPSSIDADALTTETGAADTVTPGAAGETSTMEDFGTQDAEIITSTYTSTTESHDGTTASDEAKSWGPATVALSTLVTTTRSVLDASTITSGSTGLATTAISTRAYYPCFIYGGRRVASARYVATTSMVDHKCAAYTEFPSSIGSAVDSPSTDTPINESLLQTTDGTVLSWSSYKLGYDEVYHRVTITYSEGLGPARTIRTPVPTQTSVDNDGSGQCGTSDSLSKSGLGDACDRTISGFDDDTIYTDYATRYSRSTKGVLMVASVGQAGCIAKFSCDDYDIGMSGKRIKEA
ncbi:hypothetical protein ACHAO7_009388 [Fusarium culmorum]